MFWVETRGSHQDLARLGASEQPSFGDREREYGSLILDFME